MTPAGRDVLERAVADAVSSLARRRWHTGCLVHVAVGGERAVDVAAGTTGDGAPVTDGMPVTWSCASKLALVVAFAWLWDEGRVRPQDRVADHVPALDGSPVGTLTLEVLLTHRAGFEGDPATAVDRGTTREELLAALRQEAVAPEAPARYLARTSWFVLAEALAAATGENPADLERRGLRLAGTESAQIVAVDGIERPGVSGIGPLDDLARLCSALDPRREPSPLTSAVRGEITRPWRVGMVDAGDGSQIDWGLGLPVDGRMFGESLSPRSYGHLGGVATFVVCDPNREVVIAAHSFGVRSSMHGSAIRFLLTDAVCGALADRGA